MKVYVAAPYQNASDVRDLHKQLRKFNITTTSSWAEQATGPDNFDAIEDSQLCSFASQNDSDIQASDIVLVVGQDGMGGEMFAEARIALEWGKPVIWCGRKVLSAYRHGVTRVKSVEEAISILASARYAHDILKTLHFEDI